MNIHNSKLGKSYQVAVEKFSQIFHRNQYASKLPKPVTIERDPYDRAVAQQYLEALNQITFKELDVIGPEAVPLRGFTMEQTEYLVKMGISSIYHELESLYFQNEARDIIANGSKL